MNLYFILFIFILIIFIKYFKKKYKKYLKIYQINGLDGIRFYFLNKNIKNTGINNFIDLKKNILGQKISKISKNKILYGPYAGTKILNNYGWSNTDFSPKYLGSYEIHIQEKIIYLARKYKLKIFIDLGAAEGYHIISLLNKRFFSYGIGFEINKKSRVLLKKNAYLNKVFNKLSIFSDANFQSLKKHLNKIDKKKTLFLVDIEGNEFSLFDNKFCNFFAGCFFIIEDHNFNIKNKKKINKFYNTIKDKFNIEIINDISKNPFNFKILKRFSDDEKYLMMSEGRPETMQWILLKPKGK